jgi:hypothetical protein
MIQPRASKNSILVEQIGDELVILDQQRMKAHRLNRTAAIVWRNCDGTKGVSDLAQILKSEQIEVADENLVWLTLDRLDAASLLEQRMDQVPGQIRTSRREFVRKVGMVGVLSVVLPVVTSMIVPTPAQAQTCGVTGPTG